jgi:AraC-like DNA-binding protein
LRHGQIPSVVVEAHENHDWHVLLWQARGESDVTVAGRSSVLATDRALWVPSGVRHGFTLRSNAVLLPLFFDTDVPTSLTAPRVVEVDGDLRTLALALVQSTYSIIRPEIDIARQVLAHVEARPVPVLPMPRNPAGRSVAQALLADPGDVRTVAELAGAVHTSARTVERVFRAETGMTLRRWRIAARMEAAGALVREATALDAVARRVGYSSTAAFRRVFKEHFGVPPGEYQSRAAPED